MVSAIERSHCIQDSQLGPNGVLYREVPLYTGQPVGSQWCLLYRGSTVYRTASWVPMVSTTERFHCISKESKDLKWGELASNSRGIEVDNRTFRPVIDFYAT